MVIPLLLSILLQPAVTVAIPAADGAAPEIHWPHDTVASVAVAPLPGGGRMVMIVLSVGGDANVLWSKDDGITWQILAGEGLQAAHAREVVWFGDFSAGGGGGGRFLVGTDRGVWAYDPARDRLARFDQGIPAADASIVAMDVPATGSGGPALLCTETGRGYLRAPAAPAWSLSLDTGVDDPLGIGEVAVVADFDPGASAGRRRALAATSAGRLYLSADGGASWGLHAQFSVAATGAGDWMVTAVAFADDYASTGNVVVGRARVLQGRSEGQLWHSGDGAASFRLVRSLPSGVLAVADAPPGPHGTRYLFAAARGMPGHVDAASGMRHPGILRSDDGGLTWNDHGSDQDLYLEQEDRSGLREFHYRQRFAVSPDFASDGRLYYARQEGLFQSLDAGVHWRQRQLRSEREMRGIAAARDAGGGIVVAGGAYGSGLVLHDEQSGTTDVPGLGCVMAPTRWSDASPNFAVDGTVLLAGSLELLCWYDPSKPAANPFGAQGWYQLPLVDPVSGQRHTGHMERVVFSTHYDGSGAPGSDLSFFWTARPDRGALRTLDGGATVERLDRLVGGGPAPHMESLAVAPTYHGNLASQDVYGIAGRSLYRLEGSRWREIWTSGSLLESVAVDPSFRRPSNPVLYVLLRESPWVVEVEDEAGGPRITPLRGDLSGVVPTVLRVPPDYARRPVLYLATWGRGVLRLDRAAAQPRWEPVGNGFPRAWCKSLALSPDFEQDRRLFAGTLHGAYSAVDASGSTWAARTHRSLRDDGDVSAFMTFSPGDPMNPLPTHAWPWRQAWRGILPGALGGLAFGNGMSVADRNGDFVSTTAVAEELRLWTVAGPGTGTVRLEAFDAETGQRLAGVTRDLGPASPVLDHHQVVLTLPGLREVEVRISAELDAGEVLAFDGLEIVGTR